MTLLADTELASLTRQLEELEENQYREQQRLHLVPPHYILINPESQAEYDQLLKKDRRRKILEKGFLAFPEGLMVSDDDNLLAVVNEQVFQKPWLKLELEFQINRIYLYLDQLQGLTPETLIKLRKLLVNACFRKELGTHQVIYDCQRGLIQKILGINLQTTNVSLEILKTPEIHIPVIGVSEIISSDVSGSSGTSGNLGTSGNSSVSSSQVSGSESGETKPKIKKPMLKLKTHSIEPSDSLPKRKMPIIKQKISNVKTI